MAADTTAMGKLLAGPKDGPLALLEPSVHGRWVSYMQSCSTKLCADERLAVYAKLYAAMERLNESVRESCVAEAILEIGSNLMACEQMAVVVLHQDGGADSILRSVGLTRQRLQTLRQKTRLAIAEIPENEIYLSGLSPFPCPTSSSIGITACAPVSQTKNRKGAIAFYDFLPQRDALNAGDHALVKLLSIYAGPCLFEIETKEN
jgi:hypothetical protein